jgi:hypothetical protein
VNHPCVAINIPTVVVRVHNKDGAESATVEVAAVDEKIEFTVGLLVSQGTSIT